MNIDQAVLNQTNAHLEYFEPWPGISSEGKEVDVAVAIRMSVHAAIAHSRKIAYEHSRTDLSDKDLLEDFMVVHWAQFV